MLSMLLKMPKIRVMKVFLPVIAHVTLVPSDVGSSENSVRFLALKGLMNSSAMWTLEGSVASLISILPCPTLRLPDHEYLAPGPESGPENFFSISGSISSQGDQAPQLWKSTMWAKTRSGAAPMVAER
jgi:hypothetical protein